MIPVRAMRKHLRLLLAPALAAAAGAAGDLSAAQVRLLDGRSLEGQLRFNDAGALVVQTAPGATETVELGQVASATFASGSFFSSGSMLPNGWVANDFGDARGDARLDTNTFHLRVTGRSTKALAGHFVARPMMSDGEFFARVDEISGTGLTHAGVMIRAQNAAVFAALSLGSDGRLWFQRRGDPAKRDVRLTAGPKASAPVWLRLQLKEKELTALYALDGKTWQKLASESFKLGPEKTWREGEGDLHLLRASVGVFASSRGANTRGTAQVSTLLLIQNGLVGEYFGDGEFAALKMARFDPQIRFDWRAGAPDPSLQASNFSVRWTGKLVSKKTASYSFHLDAGERARLWIDGQEIACTGFKLADTAPAPPVLALLSGRLTDIKLEFEKTVDPASVKLGWALPRQPPEVIGMSNFFYYFTGAKSPESIALSRITNAGPVVRGVVLRNGTFLAGAVIRADESAVRGAFAGRPEAALLQNRVARLILRPPRQPLAYDIAQGRRGVFMKNGDFFESELRSVEHNSLTMSSVLFGLKRFGLEDGGPLVVVLNDVMEEASGFEVRLLDGSVLRARKLKAAPATLTVEDSILGDLAIPAAELVEIRPLGVTPADAP